jgi:hypothetical protein
MKCGSELVICALMLLVFLTGCSLFDNVNEKSDKNIANIIAPEIASNGARIRKKPTQPKSQVEDIVIESHFVEKFF